VKTPRTRAKQVRVRGRSGIDFWKSILARRIGDLMQNKFERLMSESPIIPRRAVHAASLVDLE
jgi:hypothetical protein